MSTQRAGTQAGYDVARFSGEAGISRALVYRLWAAGDPVAPTKVKIRNRTVIIETPQAWLLRVSQIKAQTA